MPVNVALAPATPPSFAIRYSHKFSSTQRLCKAYSYSTYNVNRSKSMGASCTCLFGELRPRYDITETNCTGKQKTVCMIPSVASVQERGIGGWGIPFTFRALRVTAPVGCALKRNLLICSAGSHASPTSGYDILAWQKNTQRGKVLLLCDERVV